ncbi:uncharacterized protein [Cherax quadricarinatus]
MDDTAPLILWLLVNKQQHATSEGESGEDAGVKQLVSVPMWPHWTAREVQVALLKTLDMGHTIYGHSIVRVRDAHGALVPLTPTTLKSTPVQPLLLEICPAYQDGSGEGETTELPPSFRKTVQDIVTRFETRLAVVEAGVGGLQGKRAAQLEAELQRLQDTLSFMSRRLDLTRAPAWVTGGHT